MDKVAIVILNWNGSRMLQQYLPSVINNSDETVIYVADNASTDDSLYILNKNFPTVKTIVLDKNYGFAEGYNRALKQVEAEYYVLLNNDIEVTRGWLKPLISLMDNENNIAACSPKLLSAKNHSLFEYAGASGGFIDRYGYPFCRGRIFDTIETDSGQYDNTCDVMWATGACLLTRASIYNKVGGLDSRFFAHCEEIDYCWRLNIYGYRVCVVPDSFVYHLGGGTLSKSNPFKTFLNFRNNLTMLYKNLPNKELKRVMARRKWLDYVASAKMLLLEFNYKEASAVIRARKAFKNWKKDFEIDRKMIQSHAVEKQYQSPTPFSILWQYYVKCKRKFSDLQNL